MANLLFFHSNPIKVHQINPAAIPQYVSKYYEDYPFVDTIKPWEQKTQYMQPWQQNDLLRLQIEADYGPVSIKIIDSEGRLYYNDNFQTIAQNPSDGMNVLQIDKPLNDIPEGVFFVQIADFLISEPLKILANQKETVLLEYKHHKYDGDVVWATGFSPSVRVRGLVRLESPSSKDSFFEDNSLNLSIEDSKSFEVYKFIIGGSRGIPFWLAKKLNKILGCSTMKIDGIEYTRNADKLDPITLDRYPLRSYSIDLRQKLNRGAAVFVDSNVQHNKTSMIATVLGDGFGMNDGGGSEQQIQVFI